MKVLLTGQSGQLGGELALSMRSLGEVIFFPRTGMDLSDLDQVRDVIRAVKPDLIVNPAAYTAVVKAESEPALAMLINGEAPGVIAQEAQRLGIGMIHYSTDYVFDGKQTRPYDETAQTNPINVYGSSKLAGELAVAAHCETHWIFRTSWVYNVHGGNFMKTVMRLAQEKSEFTMTADQFGAPTWARTVSRVTRELLAGSHGDAARVLSHMRHTSGVYHMTAGGETSWYEYASFIVDHMRERGVPTKTPGSAAIVPIPTAPVLPDRPKSSRLSLDKLESTFRMKMPHWRSDAVRCLDEIIDNLPK
ncbi:dTDP-4-dehydrorhamnose reductase [Oxalobacteraceae bacterium CAVE-383]|nr:dTDP-4-dehydrorhamnose reductase [Oxalobacteraceae bacterium CAVE-383]